MKLVFCLLVVVTFVTLIDVSDALWSWHGCPLRHFCNKHCVKQGCLEGKCVGKLSHKCECTGCDRTTTTTMIPTQRTTMIPTQRTTMIPTQRTTMIPSQTTTTTPNPTQRTTIILSQRTTMIPTRRPWVRSTWWRRYRY